LILAKRPRSDTVIDTLPQAHSLARLLHLWVAAFPSSFRQVNKHAWWIANHVLSWCSATVTCRSPWLLLRAFPSRGKQGCVCSLAADLKGSLCIAVCFSPRATKNAWTSTHGIHVRAITCWRLSRWGPTCCMGSMPRVCTRPGTNNCAKMQVGSFERHLHSIQARAQCALQANSDESSSTSRMLAASPTSARTDSFLRAFFDVRDSSFIPLERST
jgi:hypothetical protein